MKYLGISEDRLHHILAVARKCYEVAKRRNHDEDFCRRMFMIGWLHDVGYEFSQEPEDHPDVSFEMMMSLTGKEGKNDTAFKLAADAVKDHVMYTDQKSEEWIILNIADLSVDLCGNDIEITDRLEDMKKRFGEESKQYKAACEISAEVGLMK
jgi:predicted hydrolase (HD superfamily)